jgi:hypothetical protein
MNTTCGCGCGALPPVWRKNEFTRGRLKGERARYCPGHYARSIPKLDPSVRFWSKVRGSDASTCWEWQGHVMRNGYGQFGLRRGVVVLAHRWAYEDLVVAIPDGLDLDHLCRNTRCVNPWHLDPVTRAENLRRARPYKTATTTATETR